MTSIKCIVNLLWNMIAQLIKNPSAIRRPQFNSWVGKIPWRRDRLPTPVFLGFPGGSVGKESACSVGDLGSIPGLGKSPGEERGYPQYSGPGEFRRLYSPWCCKELDTTKRLSFSLYVLHMYTYCTCFIIINFGMLTHSYLCCCLLSSSVPETGLNKHFISLSHLILITAPWEVLLPSPFFYLKMMKWRLKEGSAVAKCYRARIQIQIWLTSLDFFFHCMILCIFGGTLE